MDKETSTKRKYELTSETIKVYGHILYRIKSLQRFSDVKVGDLGGYIESEENLSHDGNCWVGAHAQVYENARIYDRAIVYGHAQVFGNALVSGAADVYGCAMVFGNARVGGNSWVYDYAQVYGHAHVFGYICIYENAHVNGDACVGGDEYIHIRKNIRIDHGVWAHQIQIGDNYYLISSTLEKILTE